MGGAVLSAALSISGFDVDIEQRGMAKRQKIDDLKGSNFDLQLR